MGQDGEKRGEEGRGRVDMWQEVGIVASLRVLDGHAQRRL